ncbi:Uu.00g032200.m01.CDS01 [Anthostomella pinea]|uniref:Uu.00g032200.m01.CDS01 n=1 Tax=Anthostomella pinea TaxID=933095 RepID=A0AAI8V988_9PEZI|nr:Uu.00g032200.m01.CDS01 [Anthostomella pinea]
MEPTYGSRLMPTAVDDIARATPDLTDAFIPRGADIGDGFVTATFSDIANATNRLAAWIESNIGTSSNFAAIAYMGLGDLRYVAVFLAAVECGFKVLLPSPRNPAWMNSSLLEQTKCSHLLYGPEVQGLLGPLSRRGMVYNVWRDFEAARLDPILILHSSGSTGQPRPIEMNHATFAVGDHDRKLPVVPGRTNRNWALCDFPVKETFFSPFPAFHLAGFSSMVALPIYYSNAALVLSPPNRPPSGHLVSQIMDHFTLKATFCPPIIVEQLVQEVGGLEKCQRLKFLLYAGGPLSHAAGEALSKGTDVCQFYGQTETGPVQALVPNRED